LDIIENEDLDSLDGVVVRSKSQVRYFITPTDSSGILAAAECTGIIGGLTNSGNGVSWEFGELFGIRTSCTTSDYIGTDEVVLFGDHDGSVYQQENGNSFDGADITSVYATPFLDFGETEQRKIMRKVNTFIRAEGPFEMNLALEYDWGDYDTAVPSNYVQETAGAPATYRGRTVNYGGTNIVYGGPGKPVMVSDVQGSGFSVRATFVTIGQTSPHSIQGLVFEFTPAGRR
jgi:hypothetical protein